MNNNDNNNNNNFYIPISGKIEPDNTYEGTYPINDDIEMPTLKNTPVVNNVESVSSPTPNPQQQIYEQAINYQNNYNNYQPQEQPIYEEEPEINSLAVVGFVLSFLMSLVGMICSIIAVKKIKKTGETGKTLAIAGIIIGAVNTVLFVLLAGAVVFSTLIWPTIEYENTKKDYCAQAFNCKDNGDGTDTCMYCIDEYCDNFGEVICSDEG